ncbi:hypothetical protein GGR57DRAFT_497534 [Xylariaceae sp. FL1272]|nr:hypothetical protein GGR57DRAFT_497534 [Xylariaceae sp. FL1272]
MDLPPELIEHILSFVPPETLRVCRLASRSLHSLTTPLLFISTRLAASRKSTDYIAIARSPHLCSCVRTIKITAIAPRRTLSRDNGRRLWTQFIHDLHCLSLFSHLQSLKITFKSHCLTPLRRSRNSSTAAEEDPEFRYWILWTIFSCLDRSWTLAAAKDIFRHFLNLRPATQLISAADGNLIDVEPFIEECFAIPSDPEDFKSSEPIRIQNLAIENLSSHSEPRLVSSDLFKRVMSSVINLRLHLIHEMRRHPLHNMTPLKDRSSTTQPDSSHQSLRDSWLAADITKRLKILELSDSCHICEVDFSRIDLGDRFSQLQNCSPERCTEFQKAIFNVSRKDMDR